MENVQNKYLVDDIYMPEICKKIVQCVLYTDRYINHNYIDFWHKYFIVILSHIFYKHLTIDLSTIFIASLNLMTMNSDVFRKNPMKHYLELMINGNVEI